MITRAQLRAERDRLNREEAHVLASLFKTARCMRRRIIDGGANYTFCGRVARTSVAGGKILLCNSHREQ